MAKPALKAHDGELISSKYYYNLNLFEVETFDELLLGK
jgi:hypothetical protein